MDTIEYVRKISIINNIDISILFYNTNIYITIISIIVGIYRCICLNICIIVTIILVYFNNLKKKTHNNNN